METTATILLSIMGSGLIGVIAWSLVNVVNQGKKIAVIERSWTSMVNIIQADIQEIKSDIMKLNNRLDLFIRSELDMLKDIVKGKEKL